MRISDWSSDVCSSDLLFEAEDVEGARQGRNLHQAESGPRRDPRFGRGRGVRVSRNRRDGPVGQGRRKCIDDPDAVTIGRSEEHTSELQSLMRISYAVFCLKKKKKQHKTNRNEQQ